MQAHNLNTRKTATKKRVGRGGKKGTYSGKGMKGQKSRSGYSKRATFEGGRSSLVTMTKKIRGFKSNKPETQVVKLSELEKKFNEGDEVNPSSLKAKNLIKKPYLPIKILCSGEINKKLSLKDVAFSKTAKEKIEKVGGTC